MTFCMAMLMLLPCILWNTPLRLKPLVPTLCTMTAFRDAPLGLLADRTGDAPTQCAAVSVPTGSVAMAALRIAW